MQIKLTFFHYVLFETDSPLTSEVTSDKTQRTRAHGESDTVE